MITVRIDLITGDQRYRAPSDIWDWMALEIFSIFTIKCF